MKTKIAIAVVLTASCYLLIAICKYWYADTKFASGQHNIRSQQIAQAYQDLMQAYKLNPYEPAIASELSIAAAYVALALKKQELANLSVAASDQAIATSPHHPNYYKSRARAMIILSELDLRYLEVANEALANAAFISPTDPRIPYNQALIAKYLNATQSAQIFVNQALDLKPDFGDVLKL